MNEFFHADCVKKSHKTWGKSAVIQDLECLDHSVIFCRCGWEFGKHFADNPSKQRFGTRIRYARDTGDRMTLREVIQYADFDEIEAELSTLLKPKIVV